MEHQSENKVCQNCKKDFIIEPDDFSFYEKIKVPPPTFCSECRLIRRMCCREERFLYKRNCVITGKSVITCFSPESNVPIVDNSYWWSDKFDSLDYGKEYDFSKPFFEQWYDLLHTVPSIPLFNAKNIDSIYTNYGGELKNVYLSFGMWACEDVMYAAKTVDTKNCGDVYWSSKCELCYELVNCRGCYGSKYLIDCSNITTSYFLYDCRNCTDCFMSSNLRNKKYIFQGEQLSREEYQEKINKINLNFYKNIEKYKEELKELIKKSLHKYSHSLNSIDSTGDYFTNTKNCKKSFDLEDCEDCSYCVSVAAGLKDTYDVYGAGAKAENMYEVIDSGDNAFKILFSLSCWGGFNINYSIFCHNSDNLFGCIGIHKKQYCILNKQYTKEQYEKMIPKIIQHMNDMPYIDNMGREYRYGEFFPSELSPFAYNETIAQEYFPLTKEQAQEQGYRWKDKEERNYNIDIHSNDIPDDISTVSDDITTKIMECAHKTCNHQCTEAFKIIPEELSFYKRMNIPLPHLCPNCRHYERLAQRNPLKLWHRSCMKEGCNNEFETSYAPDRPEIIYCEKCYQNEVY